MIYFQLGDIPLLRGFSGVSTFIDYVEFIILFITLEFVIFIIK